jgi:hypothetical protein
MRLDTLFYPRPGCRDVRVEGSMYCERHGARHCPGPGCTALIASYGRSTDFRCSYHRGLARAAERRSEREVVPAQVSEQGGAALGVLAVRAYPTRKPTA